MKASILYKKTATGAVQIWYMELGGGRYRTLSGQLDGKLTTSDWTTCEPKNVGRSNETTAQEQASKEVDAAYTLKLKSGYYTSVGEAMASTRFKPMLADKYEDRKDLVAASFAKTKVFVQPKLDGTRCIARSSGLWSRPGNPITTVPHIQDALQKILSKKPDLVLDGELYNHDLADDFNAIISAVKNTNPDKKKDLDFTADMIQYWIYDSPGEDRFEERLERVEEVVEYVGGPLRLVPTYLVRDAEEMDDKYEEFLDQGYEGQMIRLDGPYEQKRSKLLIKRKEFMDQEFIVEEICEGNGNRSGMAGYAVMRLGDGRTFRANLKGDRSYLRELLRRSDQFVGKEATVIFQNLTPAGVPRFPRIKVFHESKKW